MVCIFGPYMHPGAKLNIHIQSSCPFSFVSLKHVTCVMRVCLRLKLSFNT